MYHKVPINYLKLNRLKVNNACFYASEKDSWGMQQKYLVGWQRHVCQHHSLSLGHPARARPWPRLPKCLASVEDAGQTFRQPWSRACCWLAGDVVDFVVSLTICDRLDGSGQKRLSSSVKGQGSHPPPASSLVIIRVHTPAILHARWAQITNRNIGNPFNAERY